MGNAKEEKKILTDYEAEKLISKYIPISKNQLVQDYEEIKIKVPLVMKIISPQALHKTDIGGVKIVKIQRNVGTDFDDLIAIAKKKKLKLDGIMVQKYYEGEQLIIGIKKDPVFGHVLLFGMGGIFTEVLEDTAIRKCPISKHDVNEMIEELKASKIFHGFRGRNLHIGKLKQALIRVSQIPKKYKNLLELDINPFILNEKEGVVVDARIVFE